MGEEVFRQCISPQHPKYIEGGE